MMIRRSRQTTVDLKCEIQNVVVLDSNIVVVVIGVCVVSVTIFGRLTVSQYRCFSASHLLSRFTSVSFEPLSQYRCRAAVAAASEDLEPS